ncbi:hypothetical protein ACH3O9_01515 [Leeuwenhoekiella sp. A16]|uniref:hypothetical protein n=1 Tax=unclassified Leeuwenhoekiella TaxID=2615029 RepID=UPI003A813218
MHRITFLIISLIIISCSKDDEETANVTLEGNWQLIEELQDPGDGSAVYEPVQSIKTIQFKTDGTVTTNTSLCDPLTDEIISNGTFTKSDREIITNCENPYASVILFKLEGEYLILQFLVDKQFEAKLFYQKFEKID